MRESWHTIQLPHAHGDKALKSLISKIWVKVEFVMLSDKTIASQGGIFQKLEQGPSLCVVCPKSYPIHYDRKICIVNHMRYNTVLWKCVSVSICSQMGIFMLFINKSMLYFFMLCISIIDFTTVQWTAAVAPRKRKVGVRIPAATDPSRKNM